MSVINGLRSRIVWIDHCSCLLPRLNTQSMNYADHCAKSWFINSLRGACSVSQVQMLLDVSLFYRKVDMTIKLNDLGVNHQGNQISSILPIVDNINQHSVRAKQTCLPAIRLEGAITTFLQSIASWDKSFGELGDSARYPFSTKVLRTATGVTPKWQQWSFVQVINSLKLSDHGEPHKINWETQDR